MSLASFLTNTVEVQAQTPSALQDKSGAMVKNWATKPGEFGAPLRDILCRVRPISTRYQMLYAQRNITVTHRVYFDFVYPVSRGDRLLTDTGKTLLVKGIFDTDELGRLFVVDCEEQLD